MVYTAMFSIWVSSFWYFPFGKLDQKNPSIYGRVAGLATLRWPHRKFQLSIIPRSNSLFGKNDTVLWNHLALKNKKMISMRKHIPVAAKSSKMNTNTYFKSIFFSFCRFHITSLLFFSSIQRLIRKTCLLNIYSCLKWSTGWVRTAWKLW